MDAAPGSLFGAAQDAADVTVGEVVGEPVGHRHRLLGRQASNRLPDLGIQGGAMGGVGGDDSVEHSHVIGGQRRPGPAAMVVDRLAMGDREQPAAQVGGVAQGWVGAERGDEGLLETVVGIRRAHDSNQQTVDVALVLVQQSLEGGKDHTKLTGISRKA